MARESDAAHLSVKVPRGAVVRVTVDSVHEGAVDKLDADGGDAVMLIEAPAEGAKVKTSFYQAGTEATRMRAAFLATQSLERRRSLSAFISNAVLSEVERLEMRYNGGRPWPPVETGEIPTGAPLQW